MSQRRYPLTHPKMTAQAIASPEQKTAFHELLVKVAYEVAGNLHTEALFSVAHYYEFTSLEKKLLILISLHSEQGHMTTGMQAVRAELQEELFNFILQLDGGLDQLAFIEASL